MARPPPCPPTPPQQPASHGVAGPYPPRGRGDDPPSPRQDRDAREGGGSRARPHAPAACSRRNHEGQASPRQHARAPHGPRPGTASEHEPERYAGHAHHGQSDAKDTRFVACPGKAEGQTEARRPPAPRAPRPHRRGARRTSRPPPRGLAPVRPRPADPPHGEPAAPSQVGGNGTRPPPPPPKKTNHTGHGTGAGHAEGRGPRGTALPAPSTRTARGARATPTRGGGGGGRCGSASTHTHKGHAGNTRRATGPSPRNAQTALNGVPASEGKGHTDRTARHTHRRTRGAGRGKRGRHDTRYRPEPPEPAASAAHTRPGQCTRQGISGAPRHAPAPRRESICASPRGSPWRQASSTGPAAPAPRATTHQGGDAVGKRLQLRLLSDALTREWRNAEAGEGQGSEPREPGGLRHQAGGVS